MTQLETQINKYLVNFVKALPSFRDKWGALVESIAKPLDGLINQAEQLRHVEKADLKDVDDFEGMKERLLYRIYEGIEEDICSIKQTVDKLNKLNNDLKNKLTLLENATVNLDWDDKNAALIKGSATQPALELLLDYALDFWLVFCLAARNINKAMREIDVRDAKSMTDLQNSFKVDLDCRAVTFLIAITQYIDNEKAIT
ncbi:casein kinase 2 substrate [Holotrichia oblita]|uniref:Casein kinase 2 substrate n=1 Tax=Holotrichia oblita TaxID=644536 RepID=A0ACB9TSY0_HOLOL|nr:casein kinase 2 substrate [Holotrichia oblita]